MDPGVAIEALSEEVIDHVASLIANRRPRHEIRDFLSDAIQIKFDTHMTQEVMNVARQRLRELAALVHNDARAEAIAFLQSVIADKKVSVSDKLKAQAQLNEVLGLGAKFNPNLGANALEKARLLKDQLAAMDESVNGAPKEPEAG